MTVVALRGRVIARCLPFILAANWRMRAGEKSVLLTAPMFSSSSRKASRLGAIREDVVPAGLWEGELAEDGARELQRRNVVQHSVLLPLPCVHTLGSHIAALHTEDCLHFRRRQT